MVVEFSIVPTDKGESLSRYVAQVVDLVNKSGLDYRLTAMGTLVEGEWDEIMDLIKRCHQKTREASRRVLTSITVDDREGARGRLNGKVKSVERVLGTTGKK